MADGVFNTNDTGEIASWNPSIEKITLYSSSEAIGKTISMTGFDIPVVKNPRLIKDKENISEA